MESLMKPFSSKIFVIAVLLLAVVGSFLSGVYFGYENRPEVFKITSVFNKEAMASASTTADFAPFWRAWNLINEKYVSTATTSVATDQAKVWGAVEGLVNSLGDPYSVFLPPEEKTRFEQDIRGNFGGVGIELGKKDEVLTVIAALPGTPASKAGVLAGDKILKIGDTLTQNMTIEEAVRIIRGNPGTVVHLTLGRSDDKLLEVDLTRAIINIPTIETKLIAKGKPGTPNGVFVISLYNFNANSTRLFRDALNEFSKSGTQKLVLDLRGNPGGYLDAAVDMASWFLPKGKVVVREHYGPAQPEKIYRSSGYDVFTDKLQMLILVDKGSASASEILAGALREHGVAKLVGEQTYGKGSVQELIPVTKDTSVKLTIARWLTPNGLSISDGGLKPDVSVQLTEKDIEAKRDPQLDKAVELLGK
jgi:carboxyl-terminal processing protease